LLARLALLTAISLFFLVGVPRAETATDTYSYIRQNTDCFSVAFLGAPDSVDADTPFDLNLGYDAWCASTTPGFFGWWDWELRRDASLHYGEFVHQVVWDDPGILVASGGSFRGPPIDWSATVQDSVPAGDYTYTFVAYARYGMGSWHDVAATVALVAGAEPQVCDAAFGPPLSDHENAGRTVPLRWTARSCSDGGFLIDEGAMLNVYRPGGQLLQTSSFTGNKQTGIEIREAQEQYRTQWRTERSWMPGLYTLEVMFSSGDSLSTTVFLD